MNNIKIRAWDEEEKRMQGYDGEKDYYTYYEVKFGKTPTDRYGYYLENENDSLVFYEDFEKLEVYGNIYENKNLL